jgi:hypothetical protein
MTVSDYMEKFPGASLQCDSMRQVHSKSLKKTLHEMWKDPDYKKKIAKSMRKTNHRMWADPEYREWKRQDVKDRWADPDYHFKMCNILRSRWNDDFAGRMQAVLKGYKKNDRTYVDRKGREHHLRSSWELGFAIFLDLLELNWDYEIRTLEGSGGDWYLPDFYVSEWDLYFEIKGYVRDSVIERLRDVSENCKVDIRLLGRKELEELDVLSLRPSGKRFEFDRSRFIDHPIIGSRAERLEARRHLCDIGGV